MARGTERQFRFAVKQTAAGVLGWDDFAIVPALARDAGLSPWLYVTLWDEGWPLASEDVSVVL